MRLANNNISLLQSSMDCPIDELDFDEFGPPRKLVQASIDPSHLEGNLESFNSFKQNGSQISEAALQ
jgi:hypothetical protein